VVAK
jgi:hypothetical protein